jgi:EAL domain-containing protein (putative c-di-GMP-specific phosphodiesterase class I)
MGEMDSAMRDGHIKVHYQPKLDLKTNQVTCAEALVRWEHPTRGMLPPDSFIPLAEESGRIEDLTLHVIRQTIEDMRAWCAQGLVLGAAVNISARLLSAPSFVERAEALLANLGVPPSRLTFEVTESAELDDPDASIAALNRFRDRGIKISMDDYGTGQSTLSYLKTLPISELKIDRCFVQHAHLDRGDAMLVRSTIQLAHELGLKVVCEGIEDAECLEFLRGIECDYAQGYFVGKPMTAEALASLPLEPTRQAA